MSVSTWAYNNGASMLWYDPVVYRGATLYALKLAIYNQLTAQVIATS